MQTLQVIGLDDVVRSRLATVPLHTPLREVAQRLSGTQIALVAVCDAEGVLAGVISKTDIVRQIGRCLGSACCTLASHVMKTDVVTCEPTDLLEAVLGLMRTRGLVHLPVGIGECPRGSARPCWHRVNTNSRCSLTMSWAWGTTEPRLRTFFATAQFIMKKTPTSQAQRPMFLNLLQIQMPVGAVTSILHRLSGVLLATGVPLCIFLLWRSLDSEPGFAQVMALLHQGAFQVVMVALAWALSHHLLAGVRHMLTDVNIGSTLHRARRSAWSVNLAAAAVALLTLVVLP